jgi:hypothetical protein
MDTTQRWALCALLFGAALSAQAQDQLVLGSPPSAAPGQVVSVPVFLEDAAETPLGIGGAPIHQIDLSIMHSRPDVIYGCLGTTYPNCELQFKAAGQLAASTPETSSTLTNIDSLFVRRIFGEALQFTGGLDLIGYITFRLDPKAPPGTVILLRFDPAKTFLANHDGTIVDRGLKLNGTSIGVCSIITVNPPALPNGTVGYPYNQTISPSGGTAPYAFSVSSGALPGGLTLNGTTGAITGTPDSTGMFTFTITAANAIICLGSRAYSISIFPPAVAGPALDFAGLTILVILLAAAGLFVMNRLSI